MKYRNKRTGAVLDTAHKISGEDWEELEIVLAPDDEEVEPDNEEAVVKKTSTRRKKSGD